MESKYYWLKVTKDKFELPLCVADSREELAQMCGIAVNSLDHTLHMAKKNNSQTGYKKVLKEKYGIL